MADTENWVDVGAADELSRAPIERIRAANRELAISSKDGVFGVVANACNHAADRSARAGSTATTSSVPGTTGSSTAATGTGEPGFEEDAVPAYAVKVEDGRVGWSVPGRPPRTGSRTLRIRSRATVERAPGPLRLAGISTTTMDMANPRFSGSDDLLGTASSAAREQGAETRLIRLTELRFRACEGYYSKAAHACTWPCSITQMDPDDQMDRVYEALVQWAEPSSSRRRSGGARRHRSTSRWPNGSTACRTRRRSTTAC